jgi:hypothetical protein
MADRTRPSDETKEAERAEAEVHAGADRQPTPDEEKVADELKPDPDVSAHEKEMAERGVHQQGEGRIP